MFYFREIDNFLTDQDWHALFEVYRRIGNVRAVPTGFQNWESLKQEEMAALAADAGLRISIIAEKGNYVGWMRSQYYETPAKNYSLEFVWDLTPDQHSKDFVQMLAKEILQRIMKYALNEATLLISDARGKAVADIFSASEPMDSFNPALQRRVVSILGLQDFLELKPAARKQ
ncbi:MAG: hypothetical protein ABI444_08580 [Candidatus Kapaibacterium sp.]|jgi:hypothetical protein